MVATLQFITVFVLSAVLPEYGTRAWHRHHFPTKCKEFVDDRTVKLQDDSNTTLLVIPPQLTSDFNKTIEFRLAKSDYSSDPTKIEELCSKPRNISVTLSKNVHSGTDAKIPPVVPPSIQAKGWILRDPTPEIYFTVDGYLHEMSHFYSPDDYCVLAISDEKLVLKACKLDCSADLSKSMLYTSNPDAFASRVCLPKCCGIDETVEMTSSSTLKCRRLGDTEPLYFMPFLHLQKPIYYFADLPQKDPNVDEHTVLAHSSGVIVGRQSWNSTHSIGEVRTIWNALHFYTPDPIYCKGGSIVSESFKYDKSGKKTRKPFRLAVAPDHVQPQYLMRSRKWRTFDEDGKSHQFCVDGIDGWGSSPKKAPVIQTVFMYSCSDDILRQDPKLSLPPMSVENWIDIGFSIFSSLLLLLTFLILLAIYKTLNSQGHLILSHCTSISALYILATLGRLNYLTVSSSIAGNAVPETVDGKALLNIRTGTGCMIIAVLHHYFQYTTYFWLTLMNYDIWKRVPLLRVAGRRNVSKMTVYSLIAWGIPAVLITIFVILDECYNDPFMAVVVPDYGKEYCTVASWSADVYVHIPMMILLGLNMVLILNRLDKWCRKKCKEDGGEPVYLNGTPGRDSKVDENCSPAEQPTFPPVLFALLWCIHLVAWLVDLALWMKLFRNQHHFDWLTMLMQYVGLLGVPILLSHLYCMNDAVLQRVGTKFSALDGLTSKLRRSKLIWKNSFIQGKNQSEPTDSNDAIILQVK